jgi:hypothetical protein
MVVNIISIIIVIIIVIIMIPIIFEVVQRPVGALLFDIFRYTDYLSVILHFPSYITARAIIIYLDNNIL